MVLFRLWSSVTWYIGALSTPLLFDSMPKALDIPHSFASSEEKSEEVIIGREAKRARYMHDDIPWQILPVEGKNCQLGEFMHD